MTASRTIEAANRDIASFAFAFAGVLIVAAAGLLWFIDWKVHIDFRSSNAIPLVGLPAAIVLVALFFLFVAILNTLRVARAGRSLLDIEEAAYGRSVRGHIRTERRLDPTGDYTIRLQCIEKVHIPGGGRSTGGSGSNRRFVRWESTQIVKAEGRSSTTGIPVDIRVDAFPWPKTPHSQGFIWELTIKAPLRGLDYWAVFGLDIQSPR